PAWYLRQCPLPQ
ncbi:hypothetical protein D039_4145B, partial [Vibrio parahaemolyticus EKP-028]